MAAPPNRPELSSILPPLILGTASFHWQFTKDPYNGPSHALIRTAFENGIRAFDTSPYYGPSEEILGNALAQPAVRDAYKREDYMLLTKAGRIASDEFDYSPAWIRQSVHNSLERLHTTYLDVVYCHDVEFVSEAEVLGAVTELRRLRDEGLVRYVGISGYPVPVLCKLAKAVCDQMGEPLDAVMSWANFTLQNRRLVADGHVDQLRDAGVKVVPNASPLGMGLLRHQGVPVGSMGDFHPASKGLRAASLRAHEWCGERGEPLEAVALRHAIQAWMEEGAPVGTEGRLPGSSKVPGRIGVTVLGTATPDQLSKSMREYKSILAAWDAPATNGEAKQANGVDPTQRKRQMQELADGVQKLLGQWMDVGWECPPADFVSQRKAGQSTLRWDSGIVTSPQKEGDNGYPTLNVDKV